MSKPTRFKPVRQGKVWVLNVPGKYSVSGKRERHFHKTQVLALAAATKLKADRELYGNSARTITPSLAEQAVAAASLLEVWGVSLLEAAREVADNRRRAAASCPVNEACDQWIATCDMLRSKTVEGYKYVCKKLVAVFGERLCSSVTGSELQSVLCPNGTSGASAESNVRAAKTWWRFCAKQGWCQVDVFMVEVPKKSNAGEIGFLSVEEAKALLAAAAAHYPAAVPYYAVQLFAGIRREEVARLETKDVSPDGIELGAEITKRGKRRHITPSATLRTWLEAHPFQTLPNWIRVDKACRRLAGWNLVADLLTDPPEPTRGTWPQNALRHSHASYSIAAGKPLESLLFEFGHTGGPTLLKQHYVGRVSKREAIAYFKIAPEGAEIPAFAVA